MDRKLLKFYADWCGPCKLMKPVVDKIAEEHDLKLIEINVDEQMNVANKYGVRAVPTLVLLENGEEIARTSGANTLARTSSALGLGS